jgi:hypothetical protein
MGPSQGRWRGGDLNRKTCNLRIRTTTWLHQTEPKCPGPSLASMRPGEMKRRDMYMSGVWGPVLGGITCARQKKAGTGSWRGTYPGRIGHSLVLVGQFCPLTVGFDRLHIGACRRVSLCLLRSKHRSSIDAADCGALAMVPVHLPRPARQGRSSRYKYGACSTCSLLGRLHGLRLLQSRQSIYQFAHIVV